MEKINEIQVITTGKGVIKAGVKGVITGMGSKTCYIGDDCVKTEIAIFDIKFEGGGKHGDMQLGRDFVLLNTPEGQAIPPFVPTTKRNRKGKANV